MRGLSWDQRELEKVRSFKGKPGKNENQKGKRTFEKGGQKRKRVSDGGGHSFTRLAPMKGAP